MSKTNHPTLNDAPPVVFGYKCQECGRGTVRSTNFAEYSTKIQGYPLLIRNATIGICDSCGAKHFDAQETLRWKKVADAAQHKLVLSPLDIKELQQLVQLSMQQFAVLIGSTRQSLHAWQKQDRTIAQSRMADLMMRLLRESYHHGKIDVLEFLIEQAKLIGLEVKVRKQEESPARIVLFARKRLPSQTETTYANELAAETKAERPEVLLVDDEDKPAARLQYDYRTASLNLVFIDEPRFREFAADITFADGVEEQVLNRTVHDGSVRLCEKTRRKPETVREIAITPTKSA